MGGGRGWEEGGTVEGRMGRAGESSGETEKGREMGRVTEGMSW